MSDARKRDEYPYHRRFVRHKIRVKVEVRESLSFGAWTINVSEDGLCFEIPELIDEGREATVWLYVSRTKGGSPVRSTSARITVEARSCTGTSRREPPKPPTGVRRGSQMTASRTGSSSFVAVGTRESAPGRTGAARRPLRTSRARSTRSP